MSKVKFSWSRVDAFFSLLGAFCIPPLYIGCNPFSLSVDSYILCLPIYIYIYSLIIRIPRTCISITMKFINEVINGGVTIIPFVLMNRVCVPKKRKGICPFYRVSKGHQVFNRQSHDQA